MEVKAESVKKSVVNASTKATGAPGRLAPRCHFEDMAFVVAPHGREALAAEVERGAHGAGAPAQSRQRRGRESMAGAGSVVPTSHGERRERSDEVAPLRTTVEFFANEDGEVAAASAKMTVTARVIGDELLSLSKSRSTRDVGARSGPSDAVVEMLSGGRGRLAKVTIRHREFGTVELRVEADPDFVRVQVLAPTAAVAGMVSQQVGALRAALEDAGVVLQGFRVSVAENSGAQEGRTQKHRYHSIQEEA